MPHAAEDLIDLARYPIHQDGPARQALLDHVQHELADDGCAVLKEFLTPAGIAALTAEAESVSAHGHRSFNRTNVYFTADDPSLPEDHPRRQFFDRSNSFIPADNFGKSGPLRTVHDFPAFDPFIRDCLQEQKFFRYADPLADVIVNMAEEGNGFPWHFDTNNFTLTIALQNAEGGGAFEYAPMIRQGGENFDEVARVLNGTSDKVKVLKLEPGDLQLFRGAIRCIALHRSKARGGGTSPSFPMSRRRAWWPRRSAANSFMAGCCRSTMNGLACGRTPISTDAAVPAQPNPLPGYRGLRPAPDQSQSWSCQVIDT